MQNAFYENRTRPIAKSISPTLTPFPHLHKEIEIVYVKKGQVTVHANRYRARLSDGDLFFCFPNQIHYYEDCVLGEYYLLIPSIDLFFGLKNLLTGNLPEENAVHLEDGDPIRDCLDRILDADGDYMLTAVSGHLCLMMCELLPKLNLKPLIASDYATLQGILDYCARHYAEALTLDTVAEDLHLSKYYISHLLNRKLSIGFNDYINTLRINEACFLLENTDKKIADISEDVGFGTIRSFNRAFQHLLKQTPFQYRETLRADQSDFK